MPLLDHFHPPVSRRCRWEGLHSLWTTAMVTELNLNVLSSRFRAAPRVRLGREVEVDVGTLEKEPAYQPPAGSGNGLATAVWAPAPPSLDTAASFADQDLFEVQLVDDEDSHLVAAIELVSPRNKDRPESRRAFVVKCASYLQAGVSVVLVDVVTQRRANFHAELAQLLDINTPEASWDSATGLYAAAYRVVERLPDVNRASRLQAWLVPAAVGADLPTVPLWLQEDLAVPLDLEKTYVAACTAARISP